MTGLTIILTALASALCTCLILAWWWQQWARPRLMAQLDEEFRLRLKEASDVISARVEEAVRKGVRDGFTSLASREVLEGTTRNIARTGAGLVEDSIGRILGRRRGDDDGRE